MYFQAFHGVIFFCFPYQNPDTASSQQDYCLQRLVRGLASSRKFARVGYAVALTKVTKHGKCK